MNILFICHRIPFPPNKGDKIRAFNEVKFLAEEHKLYLAFLVDDPNDLKYVDELRRYCAAIDYEVIDPRRQKIKALPYLLTDQPLSLPCFYSSRLQQAVDRRLAQSGIDAVICFSSPMAEYVFRSKSFKSSRRPKLIMDFVDVDSDKWRMYAGFSPFPWSWVYRREGRTLQAYEKRVGEAFDWNVFVSEKEVSLFGSFCPGARSLSIGNGVDFEYFQRGEAIGLAGATALPKAEAGRAEAKVNGAATASPTLLFMGAMDYFPNRDAVQYFVAEIWPLVKQDFPAARLLVVGSKPSPQTSALSRLDPKIVVTGFVPDVRPYLEEADVFIAPLRIARGIQNKVLEAMAAGLPVVARPEAVQGLVPGASNLRVEETKEGFAAAIRNFLVSSPQLSQAGHASREFIKANYCWHRNLHGLQKVLQN